MTTGSRESRGAPPPGPGISFQTLLIASVSSLTAAIVVHDVWKGGAIVGAAVTPIIIGLVGEALRRPAYRFRVARDSSRRVPAERRHDVPPVSRERGDDPFGLWEADRRRRSPGRTWVVLGIVTGVIGFAVAAFVLTGSELVFGGSITGGPRKTTIFGGGSTTRSTTTVRTVTRTQVTPAVTRTVPAPATTVTTPAPAATTPVAPPADQQTVPTTTETTPVP